MGAINESLYLIVGGKDELEDDQQPDEGRLTVVEAEGHEELFPTNQSSEQEKAEERVQLWGGGGGGMEYSLFNQDRNQFMASCWNRFALDFGLSSSKENLHSLTFKHPVLQLFGKRSTYRSDG